MAGLGVTLQELADLAGATLYGDGACVVDRVATLKNAAPGSIAFLSNTRYRKQLRETRASAVILAPEYLDECPVNALVSTNPRLAYARISSRLFPEPAAKSGRHPTAVIADSAKVDASAWVGPHCVIEENAWIDRGVQIGPGCVVGEGVRVGEQSRLIANVTLCSSVVLGKRVLIHPGAVIGSDGFGLANDDGAWIKVPQLGSVVIGDDVEIGANTTIDCGALEDTVLENGVKLDNQIQIAHNVRIGENTALAGCVGVAGSTTIGRNCTLGGGVGISGHLEIADNTHFSGQTLVTKSIKEPGYYSGNLPAVTNGEWRKTVAHIRRLEEMAKRLKKLEKALSSQDSDEKE